ncbi:MAG TPA: c-type cytochrome [Candidatus Binataceae bacterium]|nr:c-type cytochrome [Candidatus Binataceae bacterium]
MAPEWIANGFRAHFRTLRAAGVAVAIAGAIGASPAPARCFPWSIDMYRGPEVQPYAEAPRVSPDGVLPVHGGEPPMGLEEMTIKLHNPLEVTPANLFKGKRDFDTYCAPCHGANATGNGPVAHLLSVAPKDLVAGPSKELPDGYLYGVIRDGILAMPSYGEVLPSTRRWQVVLYVRSLERAAAAKSGVAAR